jgi:hypothetical protein
MALAGNSASHYGPVLGFTWRNRCLEFRCSLLKRLVSLFQSDVTMGFRSKQRSKTPVNRSRAEGACRFFPCNFVWNREFGTGEQFAADCVHRHYFAEPIISVAAGTRLASGGLISAVGTHLEKAKRALQNPRCRGEEHDRPLG